MVGEGMVWVWDGKWKGTRMGCYATEEGETDLTVIVFIMYNLSKKHLTVVPFLIPKDPPPSFT